MIREISYGNKLLQQLELLDLGLIKQVYYLKVLMKLSKLQETLCQLTGQPAYVPSISTLLVSLEKSNLCLTVKIHTLDFSKKLIPDLFVFHQLLHHQLLT